MDLKGKYAFVTGGNTGMGRAISMDLAKHGANVCIGYFDFPEEAETAVAEIKAMGNDAKAYKLNIADEQNVIAVFNEVEKDFGKLAALVNCAGRTYQIPHPDLDAMKSEYWDNIFNVNVKGTFFCCREARKLLEKNGENGGCIVNIASTAGINAKGSCLAYACSKSAVITMTRSMARALGPNVRVLAVAPGLVRTNFTAKMDPTKFEDIPKDLCLKRLVVPEEVAAVVGSAIYGNDILTGITLVADGGQNFV